VYETCQTCAHAEAQKHFGKETGLYGCPFGPSWRLNTGPTPCRVGRWMGRVPARQVSGTNVNPLLQLK
jgi:hypothetical protein